MSTSDAFTATGNGTEITLPAGKKLTYALSGTFVGTLGIQASFNNFATVVDAITPLITTATTTTLLNDTAKDMQLRWYCSAYTSGTATGILTDVDNIEKQVKSNAGTVLENFKSNTIDIPVAETTVGQTVTGNESVSGTLTIGTASVTGNETVTGTLAVTGHITGENMARDPGCKAVNVFSIASSVVADDLFTIGADVYQVKPIATDSTDVTAGGSFNNTTNPITIVAATYPGTTWAVGTLIRVTNEIMRATAVGGGNVTLARGASGTTIAAHADSVAIFKGTALNTGGTIAVGLNATLTPTAFTPALVADINAVGTSPVVASQISVNEVLLTASAVGVQTTACSNSTRAGNVTAAAAMYGGKAGTDVNRDQQSRVPLATEVTTGKMHFQFGFTPASVIVQKITTSGGAAASWGGTIAISAGHVTLTNNSTNDFSTAHTMTISASE